MSHISSSNSKDIDLKESLKNKKSGLLTDSQIALIQESIDVARNRDLPLNQITIADTLEALLKEKYKTPKNLRYRRRVMQMESREDIKKKVEYYFLYYLHSKTSSKLFN